MASARQPNLMYPTDDNFEMDVPPEVTKFRLDEETLDVVNDLENWYVTAEWAEKFDAHLHCLLPLAEQGNVLAQYSVAVIYMTGLCYSSLAARDANAVNDYIQMSLWLARAAKQGYMCALDNLGAIGVGEEADRVRAIIREIFKEMEEGKTFPCGKMWRRAYGN